MSSKASRASQSANPANSSPARTAPPKSAIRDGFEFILITIIQVLFLMTFIAQAVQVPTGSMQNTINIGDQVFVNKFVFGRPTPWLGKLLPTREVKRGDIVVFKLPPDPKVNYVKRVIGLPGDKVWVRGKHVFVNGQELPEQHVAIKLVGQEYSALPERKVEPPPPGATYKVYYDEHTPDAAEPDYQSQGPKFAVREPYTVPPDSYFVMGDSRNNSLDSRYWGVVPRDHIVARPLYVHWSFNPNDPEATSFFGKIKWRRLGTAVK